ncbi:MAG: arginyltransferase [Gammaproteobacteria bacterium]|nr:arginyltransferase [Gammaproteobacteria bacterium]
MKSASRRLPLYLSAPHACSYLPGRQSSTLFTDPESPIDRGVYAELLQYGFRRSGRMVYAPRCEHCAQCMSVRIPVAEFAPRRGHRRVRRCNADLQFAQRPAAYDDEHYALYRRYTAARHEDGDMASATPAEYLGFLRADWCDTVFLECRLGERLIACAVTDRLDASLSAIYTYFEPDLTARSLGTLAILKQIDWARATGLDHVYLGYWVRDCRKMAYKARFRPLELWQDGRWQRFGPGDPLPEPPADPPAAR